MPGRGREKACAAPEGDGGRLFPGAEKTARTGGRCDEGHDAEKKHRDPGTVEGQTRHGETPETTGSRTPRRPFQTLHLGAMSSVSPSSPCVRTLPRHTWPAPKPLRAEDLEDRAGTRGASLLAARDEIAEDTPEGRKTLETPVDVLDLAEGVFAHALAGLPAPAHPEGEKFLDFPEREAEVLGLLNEAETGEILLAVETVARGLPSPRTPGRRGEKPPPLVETHSRHFDPPGPGQPADRVGRRHLGPPGIRALDPAPWYRVYSNSRRATFPPTSTENPSMRPENHTTRLRITGMTCDHCVKTVRKSLEAVKKGVRATVSLEEGRAEVVHPASLRVETLLKAVRAQGYGAEIEDACIAESCGEGPCCEEPAPPRTPTPLRGEGLRAAVIGSGAAAFACALRLAREGAEVTMVEEGTLGGTCVNVGCIPSKILVRAAGIVHTTERHPFRGIERTSPLIDRKELVRQETERVDELRRAKYEEVAAAEPRIRILRGRARFEAPGRLRVTPSADGAPSVLEADKVLVATGARPAVPPIPGLAGTPFWTSTDALVATEPPRHLLVLGGSATGLELAQAFRRLGSEVSVIEREARLLPREDEDVGETLAEILAREGLRILVGTETREVVHDGTSFRIETAGGTLKGDRLLVAVGREPRTRDLGLEAIGVRLGARGAVVVDDHLRTSVEGVYAAGDCTTLPQFVYVAAAAGTRAAGNMLGGDEALDLGAMPAVVFTDPQVASVGLGENEARARGIAAESRTLPLAEVPRALAHFSTDGFIRLTAEAASGRLLGARIVAPEAGEIVTTAMLAIRQGLSVDELAGTIFPYLVMAEGLKLCAQTFRLDVHRLSCCAG